MPYIKVTAEELQTVATQLGGTAQSIYDSNAMAMSRVNGLIGAGWEGAASAQFESLFARWKSGADQVQQALHGIGDLLRCAGDAYSETERQIQRSMVQ